MAKYTKLMLLIAVLAVVLIIACSDRGTNSAEDVTLTTGGISSQNHVFFDELILQIRNDFQLLQMALYIPRVSFPRHYGGTFRRVPLLVLLPPQGTDRYFFFNHGLKSLADELISSGEIEPMVIACISNDRTFGGYFYAGNSFAAGFYDDLVGDALVEYLNAAYPITLNDPSKRGIGGIGMGAYGAFRAALMQDSVVFTSVSGSDGPLDFDGGPGRGAGLIDLMDTVLLTEQTHLNANNFNHAFDSSSTCPVSRMFIGGALAFTPHDTMLDYDTIIRERTPNLGDYYVSIIIDDQTRGLPSYIITDSVTLIDSIIMEDANNFDFHLPFSFTEKPYAPIWDIWLENNLESLLAASNGLDNADIWIGTSPQARYGFHNQTMSWYETLEADAGVETPVLRTYTGYEGNPAEDNEFLYELLREMLIFHSQSFYPEGSGD